MTVVTGLENTHRGFTLTEVASLPGATPTSIVAHNAAKFYLSNMDADIFVDNHAHAVNVAAGKGVVVQANYHGSASDHATEKFSNVTDLRPAKGEGLTIV